MYYNHRRVYGASLKLLLKFIKGAGQPSIKSDGLQLVFIKKILLYGY